MRALSLEAGQSLCELASHHRVMPERQAGGTSLVVQWLRVHLPMQGTQVPSLAWEGSTCLGAKKPMCHSH